MYVDFTKNVQRKIRRYETQDIICLLDILDMPVEGAKDEKDALTTLKYRIQESEHMFYLMIYEEVDNKLEHIFGESKEFKGTD